MNSDLPLVRVHKPWKSPDLFRQTPAGNGVWDGVRFTLKPVEVCDYLIVLNRPSERISVRCPAGNRWLFVQEPPVECFEYFEKSFKFFDRVYWFGNKRAPQQFRGQTGLPWHIDKTYDELVALNPPPAAGKLDRVSWITSNFSSRPGHKLRLSFMSYLRSSGFEFDLWGKGFNFIADKYAGLFPYKYSIAIENYSTEDYWTEKIADCYLAWTMPIYFGCKNIIEYFPEESLILIDPKNPSGALQRITEAVHGHAWETALPAIAKARELVLQKHQFFPMVTDLIRNAPLPGPLATTVIPANCENNNTLSKIVRRLRRYFIPC